MVTVRPEKLREALSTKLDAATQDVVKLRIADQPDYNQYLEPGKIVKDFLLAARGVFPVIKTFGDDNLKPQGFKRWCDAWENALGPTARDLWQKMRDERTSQEHGEGADLIRDMIPITRGDQVQVFQNAVLLGVPPPPPPAKAGVRFKAYPDRPVSEVCGDYLELSRRFADDFVRDHANLIP
jgi:hypothetical protein